jgi:hypothetical protein
MPPLLRILLKILGGLVVIALLIGLFLYGVGYGWWGGHEGPGEISGKTIPAQVLDDYAARESAGAAGMGASSPKQILFGDWHVHTTFSSDAYRMSLPQMQGEGAHPPADACDFARFCSAIDFYANTDHAEHLTVQHWKETVDTVRQCNAVTDEKNPDVVAFLGWEWTQQGMLPDEHYGHKNVVLRGLTDEEITARPIAPGGLAADVNLFYPPLSSIRQTYLFSGMKYRNLQYAKSAVEARAIKDCPAGINSRDLPDDCRELAATPEDLFRKLNEWGVDSIVIPHGTTWGMYTAPGNDWRKQLTPQMHNPKLQTLFEIFSGHGNSEEYRSWRHVAYDESGRAYCPEPSVNFLPGCWRAGEIIAERCKQAGESDAECEKRAAEARQNYIDVTSIGGYLTVPGTKSTDWQDSGQCRDCFMPTFSMRPLGTAQYVMAIRNFDVDGEPMRFDFGFIGSSDNHKARGGTGYKEYDRREMTEAGGKPTGMIAKLRLPPQEDAVAQSRRVWFGDGKFPIYAFVELERQSSFFGTGALMAVHAEGRDRNAIWDAVERKETYATSGPRILLWFDLLNPPGAAAPGEATTAAVAISPMGSHVAMTGAPQFRVRAVGAFKQKPGCPDYTHAALSEKRIYELCRNECYNPSEERSLITRIEVVRIQPQNTADESIDRLVKDPWRIFECTPNPAGCEVTFADPEFAGAARDAVYYVRAIQEPSDSVNGDGLGCKKRGQDGRCLEVDMCGLGKEFDDDCLSPVEERAWSSPILVDFKR